MLLGRGAEEVRLSAVLEAARGGRSAALVLVGEPGIGKTALAEHAVQAADGFRVLSTRGVASEAELSYAGLYDLCTPLTPLLQALQPVQATALRTALGLGAAEGVTGLAVAAATLSLLAAAAEQQPVLLVVDDAHWLDKPSADALAFCVRRLRHDRVAAVVTTRPADGRPFLRQGVDELELAPLDAAAARSLLLLAGREPHDALLALAEGNPLALLELPAAGFDLVAPVRLSRRLEEAFAARTQALPTATHKALLLAATAGTADLAVVTAALVAAGLTSTDLQPAESAGLVTLEAGRFAFRHPLVRSSTYHSADPVLLRQTHAEVAAAVAGTEAAGWHLAAAARDADDRAADALDASAGMALARAATGTAAAAYERAARLSTRAADKARRFAAGADAAFLSGNSALAVALVEEALVGAPAAERGRLLHTRGSVEHFVGDAPQAERTLQEAAELLAAVDPTAACLSLTEAVGSALFSGDVARALELSERAVALADDRRPQEALLASIPRGAALVVAGRPEAARPFLLSAAGAARAGLHHADPGMLTWAALAGWWVGDDDLMMTSGRAAVDWARGHGALAALPWAAVLTGLALFRTGRWGEARAVLSDGVEAGRTTSQHGHLAMALAPLAWLDACEGRTEDCLSRVEEGLALTDRLGLRWLGNWLLRASVLLELGGTPSDGTLRLRRSLSAVPLREPAATSGWPDLVEALVRRGDLAAARELLEPYATEAVALDDAGSAAIAARLAGAVGDQPRFEDALALHAVAPVPFEVARTRLAYGETLRRAGQRVAAREHLHLARAAFVELGAAPWTRRAENELRATGERLRREPDRPVDQLTSQELQVALLVAEGRTNREVAAQLYLSPKTVEWHLSRVYAKIGVRSRTELGNRIRLRMGSAAATDGQIDRPHPRGAAPSGSE